MCSEVLFGQVFKIINTFALLALLALLALHSLLAKLALLVIISFDLLYPDCLGMILHCSHFCMLEIFI